MRKSKKSRRYLGCIALTLLFAFVDKPCRAQDASDVAKVVVPFVEKHCATCHSERKPKGDASLSAFKDEVSIFKARKMWANMVGLGNVEAKLCADPRLRFARYCQYPHLNESVVELICA